MNKGLIGLLFLVFATGCVSNRQLAYQNTDTVQEAEGSIVYVNNNALSLSDYLRRLPGVVVRGNSPADIKIMVRGINSFGGSVNDPLFVIDGIRAGRDYTQISNMVNVNDIDYIQALKGSEATIYGGEGSSGVIVIATRMSNRRLPVY